MPGFKDFKTNVERSIERTGTVRNKYGRLYQINKDNAYKGINFLIQGTSAEDDLEIFKEGAQEFGSGQGGIRDVQFTQWIHGLEVLPPESQRMYFP